MFHAPGFLRSCRPRSPVARIAGLVTVAMFMCCGAHADDVPRIDPAALLQRIEAGDASLIVVDVRTPQEFAAGHVPGALNIPYTDLPAGIAAIKDTAGKELVLYCESGRRAGLAAASLKDAGLKLLHLDGDMKAWREAARPQEKALDSPDDAQRP